MTTAFDFDSGKGHADENFPVGSVLIARRHRGLVMAFYRVARMSDDVADHPTAPAEAKLARLAQIEATLKARDDRVPEAVRLRAGLAERGLDTTHILDLLRAFRLDVTKTRYCDWADLMDYCRYSAAPVGRFMLDVHGESRDAWPASDALCAALQVINHLQDCANDYRDLDRVYVPMDVLAPIGVEALAERHASPALRAVIGALAARTRDLLHTAAPLGVNLNSLGLALEVAAIHRLAVSLNRRLLARDPLSERVHHHPAEALGVALVGVAGLIGGRLGLGRRLAAAHG
jgi:squalene synthase HpnC